MTASTSRSEVGWHRQTSIASDIDNAFQFQFRQGGKVARYPVGSQGNHVKSLIAFALAAAACGKGSDPTPTPVNPTGLTVVDPGLAPRVPLRYRAPSGTTSGLAVTARIDLGIGGETLAWPDVTTTSTVTVDEVLGDGAMRVRYAIRSATVVDRPNAAATAAQMNPAMQDVVGTQVTGTLSPTGQLSKLAVDTGGKQLPPALANQIQVMTRALERMIMPLPEVAVGPTALWTFEQPLDQTGMKLLAKSQIRVTTIAASAVTIVLTSELSGPDQDTTAAGPKVKLSSIRGTMSGTGVIDLARLSFSGELVAKLTMNMTADGETEATTTTTTLTIAPVDPAAAAEGAGSNAGSAAASGSGVGSDSAAGSDSATGSGSAAGSGSAMGSGSATGFGSATGSGSATGPASAIGP